MAQHTRLPVGIHRLTALSQAGSASLKQLWVMLFTAAEERLRVCASLCQLGAAVF